MCVRSPREPIQTQTVHSHPQRFWIGKSREGSKNLDLKQVSTGCWCSGVEFTLWEPMGLKQATSSRHHCYENFPCKGHQQITFPKPKCSLDDFQILFFSFVAESCLWLNLFNVWGLKIHPKGNMGLGQWKRKTLSSSAPPMTSHDFPIDKKILHPAWRLLKHIV